MVTIPVLYLNNTIFIGKSLAKTRDFAKIAGTAVCDHLTEMVSSHENDNVAMFDDPLETAQLFVRIEPEKEREQGEP